jgi:competence ComEA-like helix-hairpin-helix protein
MQNIKFTPVWIALILAIGLVCSGTAAGQTKAAAKPPLRIDLNKADADQLSRCPGLNSMLAKAIVDFREKSGPYKTPEDLLKVKGITKEILNRLNPKAEKTILYVTPAPSPDQDEDEPSLKPSKC